MSLKINISGLRTLYDSEYEFVQAFFDYIAERSKNSKESTVDRLARTLRKRGYECSRNDMIWLLKQLAKLGVGSFIVGRHGQKSRFQWETAMISVGKVAGGEEVEIEFLDPDDESADEDDLDEEVSAGFIRHTYNLRQDLSISVDLPNDITAGEAQRFSDYVRTLSFEDA